MKPFKRNKRINEREWGGPEIEVIKMDDAEGRTAFEELEAQQLRAQRRKGHEATRNLLVAIFGEETIRERYDLEND